MATIKVCDKCGAAEAFYFVNLRDPFAKKDSDERVRSLKRDLCRRCSEELAKFLGFPKEATE